MHYGPRRWLNQQFGKSNSLSSRLVNLFHITHTWMILKQTCSWSLRRQTFAICIPLSPMITFSEKNPKPFLNLMTLSRTKVNHFTLLHRYYTFDFALLAWSCFFVRNYFDNLNQEILTCHKINRAIMLFVPILKFAKWQMMSQMFDLPHQTWVLWVLPYRGEGDVLEKKVNRYSSAELNVQAGTSSNRRLPSPFITEARSVSVPGPVP